MTTHALPGYVSGRHRLARPDRVHCRRIAAVDAALTRRSRPWLRYLRPAGRHTWGWLTRTGGQPKAAFALILSL
ncbi:MAG: hypothetical protein H0U09_04450 [Geodermatophilaceae bacterium]|jgi:hypothetical protein|nr:hypothetical protein [Geodermatophilaceae bacterium]